MQGAALDDNDMESFQFRLFWERRCFFFLSFFILFVLTMLARMPGSVRREFHVFFSFSSSSIYFSLVPFYVDSSERFLISAATILVLRNPIL